MTAGLPLPLSGAVAAAGNWIPGLRPANPFPAFNFAVELDGLFVGGFSQVTGLGSEIETTEYPEGGVNHFVRRLPGHTRHPNLVLSHGLSLSTALWQWHDDAVHGRVVRRNGTIVLLDRSQVPVVWWNFRRAFPVRWTGPTFDAGADAVAVESVELVHEGLDVPLVARLGALAHGVAGMLP